MAVAAAHILGLDPPSRTIDAGQSVIYNILLKNPTGTEQTYALGLIGLEDLNANLVTSATVPPGQILTIPLAVNPSTNTPSISRVFSVTAQTATSGISTVQGELNVVGETGTINPPPPPPVDLDNLAVDIALTPTTATAGQGTAATYTVRVTNLGDETATYNITGGFPAGFSATLAETSVTLLPGLSNFRDVTLKLTPLPGTAVTDYPFTITATAVTDPQVSDQAPGTLRVVGLGVDVDLRLTGSPTPPTTLDLVVTNTGQVADTFDLALADPVALFATLPITAVALAPGASQTIPVSVAEINAALPGSLDLTAVATARSDNDVRDTDTAQLGINQIQGLTVEFDPHSQTLPAPGPATFLLQVQNSGNSEGEYQAVITATNGPLTASLDDLNGQPTQRIETFRLPGLATGALVLDTTLASASAGTVTVEVASLSDPALKAADTATVRTQDQPSGNQAPIAAAGPDRTAQVGQTVVVDGSTSRDPDNRPAPLRFTWTLLSVPPGSALNTGDLATNAPTAQASFTPDVPGEYRLRLTVSDGELTAADEVLVTVTSAATPIPTLQGWPLLLLWLLLMALAVQRLRRREMYR